MASGLTDSERLQFASIEAAIAHNRACNERKHQYWVDRGQWPAPPIRTIEGYWNGSAWSPGHPFYSDTGIQWGKEDRMASPNVTRLMLELAGAMQRLLAEIATLPGAYQLPMLGAVQRLHAIHMELLEDLLKPKDEA